MFGKKTFFMNTSMCGAAIRRGVIEQKNGGEVRIHYFK